MFSFLHKYLQTFSIKLVVHIYCTINQIDLYIIKSCSKCAVQPIYHVTIFFNFFFVFSIFTFLFYIWTRIRFREIIPSWNYCIMFKRLSFCVLVVLSHSSWFEVCMISLFCFIYIMECLIILIVQLFLYTVVIRNMCDNVCSSCSNRDQHIFSIGHC